MSVAVLPATYRFSSRYMECLEMVPPSYIVIRLVNNND
jgi:hypothetical protein